MRSRYCAFALKLPQYIIKTTHKENQDYTTNTQAWKEDILEFCETCSFEKLEILDFSTAELDAYVTFRATIFCDNQDSSFTEKSKFLKVDNMWLYHSGEIFST